MPQIDYDETILVELIEYKKNTFLIKDKRAYRSQADTLVRWQDTHRDINEKYYSSWIDSQRIEWATAVNNNNLHHNNLTALNSQYETQKQISPVTIPQKPNLDLEAGFKYTNPSYPGMPIQTAAPVQVGTNKKNSIGMGITKYV